MKYAEIQIERGGAPLLVAFNDIRERDAAAAAFGGRYFYDMPWSRARRQYDLRRYDNPRYCKSVEIGGRVYEAILTREDAKHEELARAAMPDQPGAQLRHKLELLLTMMEEE